MSDPVAYPPTQREDVSDELFGVTVADPYRWLETDVRESDRVRAWVEAENAVTDAYLDALPGRAALATRMRALFDYERFGVPVKKGGRYFYQHNSGLQNQPVLYVRETLDGEGRVLIDPNQWAEDGATALAEWLPSEDGTRLLYAVQDGGTDWRTVHLMNIATGEVAADAVRWVKFSNFAWAKNGAGFFYSRFPAPAAHAEYQALNLNHAIYFHTLGTDQAQDRLVFSTPDRPRLNSVAEITDDGNWLLVTSSEGTDDRYELTVIDLTQPRMTKRVIVRGLENHWSLAGNLGSTFYFVTDTNAPRRRIVTMDVASMTRQLKEIVPQDEAVLEGAAIVGGVLLAQYLVDVKNEVRRFDLKGKALGTIALPGIGSVAGFGGEADDSETFYAFTSFATPTTIYRYDIGADESMVWAAPRVDFDPEDYAVEQTFFTSKDGTRVPMFVVGRKDLPAEPQPTILYGYGGFNIPVAPAFSTARLAWIEQGGVFAVANIRGGGEYGKEWHEGGRLANKQNSFDDFIAAAEHLIAQRLTERHKLAIQGASNGGLLVGAVVNQRPELFAAALPAVGVMDMLRFDRWTAGRYWVDDYGSPAEEAAFRTLFAYSPYHNIASGRAYPAILATTADTDDRVVPAHTFKYVAALQHADVGDKPHLVRIETRAGHGSGKPTDKIIEEAADTWAFAAKWTGLKVG
ncbi:MAG TPA: prolyl oligopeptidase family serine peptidase [Sphingomonas sp.]|nr:prolyl oligopeptidase family serine peptidase [Sphingomonas sp.]